MNVNGKDHDSITAPINQEDLMLLCILPREGGNNRKGHRGRRRGEIPARMPLRF